jgi:stalled ribosome alternative rescue factor ArfA
MKSNIVAQDLRSPKYKMRVVKSRKGKGSFKRNDKHKMKMFIDNSCLC